MLSNIISIRSVFSLCSLCAILFACNTAQKEAAAGGDRIPDTKHRVLLSEKRVLHFNSWKDLYHSQDSIRESYHVGHYMAGRGIADTNQVYVIDLISDSSKIDDYLALPFLGAMRSRTGVMDSVVTHQIALLRDDTTVASTQNRLVLIMQVADAKKTLDALDQQGLGKRKELGMIDRGVGVSEDQKTMYVFFAVPDFAKVDAFLSSADYTKWLETLGASGSPRALRYKIEM